MLSKNKLRKLPTDKLMEIVNSQSDPARIILCQQIINDRNNVLVSRKEALIEELLLNRTSTQKTVIELKDSMKQKLRAKEKIIVDKSSRPSGEEMKDLSTTFTITEKQSNLCTLKDKRIGLFSSEMQESLLSHKNTAAILLNTTQLDQQFQRLNRECEQEIINRNKIQAERDRLREHYAGISGQIQHCRIVYEEVEEKIRKSERQLIQLISYLDTRSRQDAEKLSYLRRQADDLESELLKGQEMVNANSDKRSFLEMTYRETTPFSSLVDIY